MPAQSRQRRMHCRSSMTSGSLKHASAQVVQVWAQSKQASMHATSAAFTTPPTLGWVEMISWVCIADLLGIPLQDGATAGLRTVSGTCTAAISGTVLGRTEAGRGPWLPRARYAAGEAATRVGTVRRSSEGGRLLRDRLLERLDLLVRPEHEELIVGSQRERRVRGEHHLIPPHHRQHGRP